MECPPPEFEAFVESVTEWFGNIISFHREGLAAKEVSIRGMAARMWAFLGFATKNNDVDTPEEAYDRPDVFVSFIAFLKVRSTP